MRLVIDDESARSSCIGSTFRTPLYRGGGVTLPVVAQRQKRSKWCWAAIAAMASDYYGVPVPQTEVVARVLGACADPDLAEDADVERRLDEALTAAGIFGHWSFGKPMFDRVRFEIQRGRPFAARIGWFDGAAHYVLVQGYVETGRRLMIFDPLHGSDVVDYADFPSSYRRGGAWTETLWTRPSHAHDTDVTPTIPENQASEHL